MAAKLDSGAYLSSFVDVVLEKLCSILEDDSVLEGNDSAVELLGRLEKSLCDVEPVLDDAELKQLNDKRVKKWLVDLQDALYLADDLLDELSTKAATATPRDPGNSSSWSHYVDSCIEDDGVNNAMEKIVGTLESLVGRKGYLRLQESAKLDTSWRLPSTSLVVSSDIFGRDQDKENIIKLLLDDSCDGESPVTVIPIVGMGGIGKTTLAQLVYNDVKVVEKFDTRAWVCVAENPDPVHVTKTIIGAIDSCLGNMDNFDSLQTNLKKKLTGKTFLVVLDDVWDDQRDMWEDFLKPFRYGNNASKIILTTRDGNVASVFAPNSLHYPLSLLSNEDCWSVFLKHSTLSTNSKHYANVELIGRKIVEKCKGLPLAVKTLGGLLRNKYNEREWENILECEIWELSDNDCKIVPALRVSYHYLPSHLKRCFVYCSLFPEDYEFDKDELILLWMAEELLQPKKNNTLKNIGCAYFDELVARSFFQPSSKNGKLFVMHDLMHDLAIFFAGKFYFKLEVFENLHVVDRKIRHLSLASQHCNIIPLFGEACKRAVHLRTAFDLSLPNDKSIDSESNPWLLQKQLRVLSFYIKSLPDSIGELIHLRYLNLSSIRMVRLPESICKLYNLQTLKLRDCCNLKMLPSRMQDLVNLHHLDIRKDYFLKEMPKKMSKLKHLNFLSDYIVGKHEENGIGELGTLDNLHGSFSISNLENVKKSSEALEAKMGNKKHIKTLVLNWFRDGYIYDVETERDILDKLQPHPNLKKLSIYGYRGKTFPDWLGLSRYSNMTKLTLNRCNNCRELPSLGQLPSLQHLELSNFCYSLVEIGFELYNKNNGSFQQETPFKSLETLKIEHMAGWKEWHFPDEFDGFPQLRILQIINCLELRGGLPAHLPALEELKIAECENLACSLPRAPKLHQLFVEGYSGAGNAAPHEAIISKTQLAKSVFEWLTHIKPPRVQRLEINNCPSAITISTDYLPASLQYLEIFDCSKLTFSEQLQHKSLTKISIAECGSLTLLTLGALPNLKRLTISGCQSMEYVEMPEALPSLGYLRFSDCPSLVSLPPLGLAAPHLEELDIWDCPGIDCFAEECLPPSLKRFGLTGLQKLASWITSKGLQSQGGLTHLTLGGWFDVKSFPREGWLPASLEYLELSNFPNLETLDCKGLHHLTSLKDLRISDCRKLEYITEEHLLTSTTNISMGEKCPLGLKLEEMNDLRIHFDTFYEYSDDSDGFVYD